MLFCLGHLGGHFCSLVLQLVEQRIDHGAIVLRCLGKFSGLDQAEFVIRGAHILAIDHLELGHALIASLDRGAERVDPLPARGKLLRHPGVAPLQECAPLQRIERRQFRLDPDQARF